MRPIDVAHHSGSLYWCRWCGAAAVIALLSQPVDVGAQGLTPCEAFHRQPSVSAFIGLPAVEASLVSGVVEESPTETVDLDLGPTFSAAGLIPLSAAAGIRVEFAHTRLGLTRHEQSGRSSRELPSGDLDAVSMSQFTVGIRQAYPSGKKPPCAFWGLGGGVSRFSYAGVDNAAATFFGVLNVEQLLTARTSVIFDLQMQLIKNGARPPLASDVMFVLRPSVGIQVRF
jgi:hypothetical protein